MKALYNNYFRKNSKNDPVLKALESVPIFDGLSHKELSEVARLTHERTYKKDEHIFKQHAPGEGMYVILDGAVEIKDPESGDKIWVDINSKKDRSVIIKSIEQKWNNFILRCNRNQFDVINISTDKDYVDPLMNYFRKRDKSY